VFCFNTHTCDLLTPTGLSQLNKDGTRQWLVAYLRLPVAVLAWHAKGPIWIHLKMQKRMRYLSIVTLQFLYNKIPNQNTRILEVYFYYHNNLNTIVLL